MYRVCGVAVVVCLLASTAHASRQHDPEPEPETDNVVPLPPIVSYLDGWVSEDKLRLDQRVPDHQSNVMETRIVKDGMMYRFRYDNKDTHCWITRFPTDKDVTTALPILDITDVKIVGKELHRGISCFKYEGKSKLQHWYVPVDRPRSFRDYVDLAHSPSFDEGVRPTSWLVDTEIADSIFDIEPFMDKMKHPCDKAADVAMDAKAIPVPELAW